METPPTIILVPMPLSSNEVLTRKPTSREEFDELQRAIELDLEVIQVNLGIASSLKQCNACNVLIQARIKACKDCIADYPYIGTTLEEYRLLERHFHDRVADFSK